MHFYKSLIMFIFESFQILSFSPSKNSNLSSLPRVRALFVSHSLFEFSHTHFVSSLSRDGTRFCVYVTGSRVQIKEKRRWKGIGLGWGWDIGEMGREMGRRVAATPISSQRLVPMQCYQMGFSVSVCLSVWVWERASWPRPDMRS